MPLWGTRAGLEELPVTTRLDAAVSASLMVKLIAAVNEPCAVVWLGMFEISGGELTEDLTVRRKVAMDESEPSLTVRVIVAVPN